MIGADDILWHTSQKGGITIKLIVFYLIFMALGFTTLITLDMSGQLPKWIVEGRIPFLCIVIGGLGGCLYCLRAIYVNACVHKAWDEDWKPWYYIRPVASAICGGISWLFLKAGLIVLESSQNPNSSNLGFYALAFIAGLNVDKFLGKLEEVAQSVWGIEKSRASKDSGKDG